MLQVLVPMYNILKLCSTYNALLPSGHISIQNLIQNTHINVFFTFPYSPPNCFLKVETSFHFKEEIYTQSAFACPKAGSCTSSSTSTGTGTTECPARIHTICQCCARTSHHLHLADICSHQSPAQGCLRNECGAVEANHCTGCTAEVCHTQYYHCGWHEEHA